MHLSHFCCSQVNCAYASHFINLALECGNLLNIDSEEFIPKFIRDLKLVLQTRSINYLCFQCQPRSTLMPVVVTATWASIQGVTCYPPGTVVPMNHVRTKIVLCYSPVQFLHVDILCYIGGGSI
jgi:hypothetical protein